MGHTKTDTEEVPPEPGTLRASVAELKGTETEREPAEEARLLAQFTIDHAAMATFWIGPDARVLRVNDAACRSLGYSRAELLSMTVHDFDPDFPPERWLDHWKDLQVNGSMNFESHHRTKNRTVFPVEIFANHLAFKDREYKPGFESVKLDKGE